MNELNKQEKEMSFEEAFEDSMVSLRSGDIVRGRVIGYNNAEVLSTWDINRTGSSLLKNI